MQANQGFSYRRAAGWFEWLPVALGAGIIAYSNLSFEPNQFTIYYALLAAILLLLAATRLPRGKMLLVYLAMSLIGFAAAIYQTSRFETANLREPLFVEKMRARVIAVVPDENRQSALLEIQWIKGVKKAYTPRRVRLSLRGKDNRVEPGQIIETRGKIFPPSPPLLPGEYDFARYFFYRDIHGVGYIIPPVKLISSESKSSLATDFQHARQRLEEWLLKNISAPANGIAVALVTGDTLSIDPKAEEAVRSSGLAHILSISGMHMAIVCGFFFVGFRFLLAAIPSIANRTDIKKISALLALLAGFAYLTLADFPVSAVRAYVMMFFFFLGVLLDRQAITVRSLAWAAIAILLVQPSSLFEAGFQLSFVATLALVVFYRQSAYYWERRMQEEITWWQRPFYYIGGLILTSLVASLATAPFVANYFNIFNAYSILANLLALPLLSFVIMPSLLFGMALAPLGLSKPFMQAAGKGIDWMIDSSAWVTSLPGANWYIPPLMPGANLLIGAGILVILLSYGYWRWIGIVPILIALASAVAYQPPDILIDRELNHVALQDKDGQWWLWRGRSNRSFTARYWQEKQGIELKVWDFEDDLPGLFCTRTGCTWRKKGKRVILPWRESYIPEACLRGADLIITRYPLPAECKDIMRITPDELSRNGGIAVWLTHEAIEINGGCGKERTRPWSGCRVTADLSLQASKAISNRSPRRRCSLR